MSSLRSIRQWTGLHDIRSLIIILHVYALTEEEAAARMIILLYSIYIYFDITKYQLRYVLYIVTNNHTKS